MKRGAAPFQVVRVLRRTQLALRAFGRQLALRISRVTSDNKERMTELFLKSRFRLQSSG